MSHRGRVGAASVLALSGVACLGAAALLGLGAEEPRSADTSPVEVAGALPPAVTAPHSGPDPGTAGGVVAAGPPSANVEAAANVGRIGDPTNIVLAGVTAGVVPVGLAPDGGLDIPADPATAGWWVGGAAPGDGVGSVVIVGHLDSASDGLGAFRVLLNVAPGARVVVNDRDGRSLSYTVQRREQVNKAQLPRSLFDVGSSPRLVLITCGGRFDPATHYRDNVVVVATPA